MVQGRFFKCKSADTTLYRGYQKDHLTFNFFDFDRWTHIDEREERDPYIEASQTQTMNYVDDIVNKGRSVVVHLKTRDLYDMREVMDEKIYANESYRKQEVD